MHESQRPPRLKPRYAVAGVAVGGFVAVIASAVVSTGVLLLLGEDPATPLSSFPAVAASVVTMAACLVATAFLVPALAGLPVRAALGLHPAPVSAFPLAAVGVLALGPTSDALVQWMAEVAPELTLGALEGLEKLAKRYSPWLLAPFLALLPGIGEELFFRGMLQRSFASASRAILVSGVLFAGFHLDPRHVVGVLPLGFYLAYVAWVTDSTWVVIFAHATNNALALIVPRFQAVEVGSAESVRSPWWAVAGGLVVALVVAGILHRIAPRRDRTGQTPTSLAPADG